MARTRLDAFATVFAKASGRPEHEVLVSLKAVLIPQMKDPSRLQQEISEAEYQSLSSIGDEERAGIIKWMLEGANGSSPTPNN